MTTVKSNGLLGLPHYRASRVSTSLYEPLYLNTWVMQMTPPKGLGYSENSEIVNVVLEGLTKVGGLQSNKVPGVFQQQYKGSDRSFAGAKPENTYMDITTDWELNLSYETGVPSSYTYKFLRQWCDLIYDPLTGRMSLKKEYVAPRLVITLMDRAATPYHQWILYNTFPTDAISNPELDYSNGTNNWKVSGFKLRCDFWDESVL